MAAVVFDASFLVPLLDPRVKGISDNPRIIHLYKTLDREKATIIVPTPALSEVLIGAGDAAPRYLEIVSRSARFRIAPFGERAAVEAADAHRRAIGANDKKEGSTSWAKIKFDRQIFAIAKVEGAECIYSNDGDIVRLAKREALSVVTVDELPEPPPPGDVDQHSMFTIMDEPPAERG
jgi:predicted nucleic acid-binding protein